MSVKKPTYEELLKKVKELEESQAICLNVEKEQKIISEVIELIRETENLSELVAPFLQILKKWSDCEAVAIRLKDGDDYPYFAHNGFSDDFIENERYLCLYDKKGKPKKDSNGDPFLECMCGNIIKGIYDPDKNFFTDEGDFWSNCTTKLLKTTSSGDRLTRTRNKCNSVGYESVALIPVRSFGETFGLIQMNDKREGVFTLEQIGIYRRVTDFIAGFMAKRQTKEALKRNEMRLKILLNTLPDLVWLKDEEGAYVACNPRFEEFIGRTEKDIKGKTDYDLIDKKLADLFRSSDLAAMKRGRCVFEEEVEFASDGHRELLEAVKTPIFDEEGKAGILGIARDITQHKHTEMLLKTSEKQLRLFIEHMPASIAMLDRNMCYLAASRRWIKDYRLESSNLAGKSHLETFHDIPGHWKEIYNKALSGEIVEIEEECITNKNGELQWIYWEVHPWYNVDSTVGGIIILTEDITSKKYQDEENRRIQDQLVQSRKMESVGRLAGGIAHDLNNLLTPIFGYSEILQYELNHDESLKRIVDEIFTAGKRARDLVQQLLAFSRKQTLEYNRIDINNVLVGFYKLLRRTIPEDIEIIINTSNEELPVMADSRQIEQVIMNLAVNAADAMSDGGVLTIKTYLSDTTWSGISKRSRKNRNKYVGLSIRDNGHGMDEETKKQIFEPFFSTKGEHGTGLGLATVYGIVRQHDGNIHVISEPGKGTEFRIYLPVTDKAVKESKQVKREGRSLNGNETILLVEDNEQVRNLTFTILKRSGYKVLPAANSNEALNIADSYNGTIHMLLTDVVMPGLNGKELYEKLILRFLSLRVLYMSGYADNVIANRGILREGVHLILKPFSNKALTQKVREVLDEPMEDIPLILT